MSEGQAGVHLRGNFFFIGTLVRSGNRSSEIDVAFIGNTAYALVTLVGEAVEDSMSCLRANSVVEIQAPRRCPIRVHSCRSTPMADSPSSSTI